MAHSISAKKRIRQNARHRLQNKAALSAIRTYIKKALQLVEEGNREKAAEAFKAAVKKIDKAAQRFVIHPNNAARKKASLAKALAGMAAEPPAGGAKTA